MKNGGKPTALFRKLKSWLKMRAQQRLEAFIEGLNDLRKGDTNLAKALRSGEVKVFILKLEDLRQPFLSDKSLHKMFIDIVMKDLLKYVKAQ
uniref:Uncharacterized protein n=1 Tax=Chromera velia CCMP2878 TaxID=1169474 RepID=A0A0G4HDC1_9ALVE|eukprot:Cvel_26490.t1-p1 / transcript=Cvel_26490.t1 / gene=Cvel_26490 / organism=Chromera_velia_CCMP2878 / gene_product=hypothetical protein / transcript_product=hypothetical protein / location=Cvel_scaffold3158:1882-2290(+) / protein_length=91 / sequence_SO=supercontig / SO=protein_coding / is_pseudo=false